MATINITLHWSEMTLNYSIGWGKWVSGKGFFLSFPCDVKFDS